MNVNRAQHGVAEKPDQRRLEEQLRPPEPERNQKADARGAPPETRKEFTRRWLEVGDYLFFVGE